MKHEQRLLLPRGGQGVRQPAGRPDAVRHLLIAISINSY